MKNTRKHIFITGRVQGVLFRAGAQKEARALELTGWAHNLIDGRVELLVEGEDKKVQKFIEWCHEGTPMAKVEEVKIEDEEYKKEFDEFTIREFGF